jgi:branched-chain amino acid transport system ATP-binding protein
VTLGTGGAALTATVEARTGTALAVANLEVVYNDVVLVLRGVSLAVPEGSIVALLGANGAGKTTLLRAVTGLLDVHRGRITKGSVTLGGRDITDDDPPSIVRSGLAQVMEGRRIERVVGLFPVLKDRLKSTAGYLSGGEQQMLAIGRALMAEPRVLLLDEPSLGLAPIIVEQIRDLIVQVNEQGTSVLLVEQNATMALSIADEGYVLEHGRIVRDGAGQELLADKDIREFYLGMGEAGRRSFRDVKTYRRKKSWGT